MQQHAASQAEEERGVGGLTHRTVMLGNALLALVKISAGLIAGSSLILVDGLHSIADLVVGAVIWLGYRAAQRPPDDDHHYGHGKAEGVVALLVGVALAYAGVDVARRVIGSAGPEYTGGELALAMGAAVFSLVANEWLALVTRRAATALDSPGLRALSRDKRSDSLTSLVALIGLGAGGFGLHWAEPAGTVVISGFILMMGLMSLREGLDILTDRVADPGLRARATSSAQAVSGVRAVQLVRFHPLGSRFRVDMEVSVDGELSVRKGHEIAHEVEDEVTRAMVEVVQVTVHVNPADS